MQQKAALLKQLRKESVYKAFWNDFWKEVDKWRENGEQLVISGDWNVDVRKSSFLKPFKDRHLIPSNIQSHGLNGPGTYQQGKKPIDEIFISDTLQLQACGYMANGEAAGNHCPIWVEVSKVSTFGTKLQPPLSYQARRLKCIDPRIVNRYNQILLEEMRQHKIFTRLNSLYNSFQVPLTWEQRVELEEIDRIRVDAMILAEKKCCKLCMGKYDWSPRLQHLIETTRYLKLTLSRRKGVNISARLLIRLSRRLNLNCETWNNKDTTKLLLDPKKEFKQAKKDHSKLRQTYLEDLAEELERSGNGTKASHLRQLQQRERQREMYRKIKAVSKTTNNLGTTFIIKTHHDGEKETITDKEKMEEAIINENIAKYHQTETTCSFLHHPLRETLGDYGQHDAVSQVTNGTFPIPTELDQYTKVFLEVCARTEADTYSSFPRSPLQLKDSWSHAKEKTSSNGQLHFGHYKAGVKNDLLLMLHYILAEIPFRVGYSMSRWQNATNLMLLKSSGLFNVEELRTIVLYEADLNNNCKFYGQQLMSHAISNARIAKEQYSRPGRKSIDHALNRWLLFDLSRYQKSSMAFTSCDLKSCYDRVAHTPALLALLGFGTPKQPLLSLFHSIQHMKYTTRTTYGDSERTFGGMAEGFHAHPQGFGQGNGMASQGWSGLSSKIFEVLHKQQCNTTFMTLISLEKLTLSGLSYVDDADMFSDADGTNDLDTTIDRMERTVDCWEGTAKSTGGAIKTNKSWWYLLHYQWDNNGNWSYGSNNPSQEYSISCFNPKGEREDLEYLSPDEGKKMLGVHLTPKGSNKLQLEKMHEKIDKLVEHIRVGHLQPHEAWISLTTMVMKSLEYGLPALTLTEAECTELMWKILKTYLPKSKINQYIKRDVLYGGIGKQGLGLRNLFLTQGVSHVISIVEHLWKETITGYLIRASLENIQLAVRMNIAILDTDFLQFEHLLPTDSWIRQTWHFMSTHNITLKDNTPKIHPQRQNDVILMERFKSKGFSTTTMNYLNEV